MQLTNLDELSATLMLFILVFDILFVVGFAILALHLLIKFTLSNNEHPKFENQAAAHGEKTTLKDNPKSSENNRVIELETDKFDLDSTVHVFGDRMDAAQKKAYPYPDKYAWVFKGRRVWADSNASDPVLSEIQQIYDETVEKVKEHRAAQLKRAAGEALATRFAAPMETVA